MKNGWYPHEGAGVTHNTGSTRQHKFCAIDSTKMTTDYNAIPLYVFFNMCRAIEEFLVFICSYQQGVIYSKSIAGGLLIIKISLCAFLTDFSVIVEYQNGCIIYSMQTCSSLA